MIRVIVDANVVHKVFFEPKDQTWGDLHEAIMRGKGFAVAAVAGGGLYREYEAFGHLANVLMELQRAGRFHLVPNDRVDQETEAIRAAFQFRSNDLHVIALARVAGVRILCSKDTDLHSDFRDKRLIDRPRGKVYQGSQHNRLLR